MRIQSSINHKRNDDKIWFKRAEKVVRVSTSITLPKECLEWLDRKVESRVYANRSHAIEVLILEAMKGQEENKRKIKLL